MWLFPKSSFWNFPQFFCFLIRMPLLSIWPLTFWAFLTGPYTNIKWLRNTWTLPKLLKCIRCTNTFIYINYTLRLLFDYFQIYFLEKSKYNKQIKIFLQKISCSNSFQHVLHHQNTPRSKVRFSFFLHLRIGLVINTLNFPCNTNNTFFILLIFPWHRILRDLYLKLSDISFPTR